MIQLPHEEDTLAIVDDEPGSATGQSAARYWRVLIADDDREVHEATLFALANVVIEERRLVFLHAYSAQETEALLRKHDDIAVLLLDVVMEREDTGLALVGRIRNELGRSELRIILRTGQPGYAPELKVIREYDINDYKTKSELTLTRLVTTLTTAIRSYRQIRTIMESRRGLELIVDAAIDLFSRRGLTRFGEGVLTQVFALISSEPAGFLCIEGEANKASKAGGAARRDMWLTHAVGEFAAWRAKWLSTLGVAEISARVDACLERRHNLYSDDCALLYLSGAPERRGVVYLATRHPLSDIDRRLLDVFAINVSVGLENVNLFQDLDFHAFSDRLTCLPNRGKFILTIDQKIGQHCQGCNRCTVALLDIDHFSETNDALGHRIGDQLLLQVALRLEHACGTTIVVARIGPDVFGLLGPREAIDAARFLGLFDAPFAVEGYSLTAKATMGLAEITLDGEGGLGALRAATIALNRAKRVRRGHCTVFTADMAADREQRLTLLNELRAALRERRGLELHYQPQINFHTQAVVGAEALLRWRRSNGEYVPPDRFISLAEYSGLIVELGAWVFETAVAQLAAWERCGLGELRMAINVSLAQFSAVDFLPTVRDCVRRASISAGRVELEITESVAMVETARMAHTLNELKQLGFLIAIDDFGTGFSSLSYLHELPIDRLKIDRAFIHTLSEQVRGKSIAGMVVGLGHSLGLAVIAEGVETEAQAALLRDMQCDEAQGYLYGKPMPADQFAAWYADWTTRRAGA